MAPLRRRTLAPIGQTPPLPQQAAHRRKISVAAALRRSPRRGHWRLFWQCLMDHSFDGDDYAEFLADLAREVSGPLVVLHDRGRLHGGDAVEDLLDAVPRITLEEFPPYSPELNPAESLWDHLKAEDLANFAPHDLAELFTALHQKLVATSQDQARLQSFLNSSELPWDDD